MKDKIETWLKKWKNLKKRKKNIKKKNKNLKKKMKILKKNEELKNKFKKKIAEKESRIESFEEEESNIEP